MCWSITHAIQDQISDWNDPALLDSSGPSESLKLALQFAFSDLNLQRGYLYVFTDNPRAIRAYEKSGFVQEGRLRRAAYFDGSWKDVLLRAAPR